MELIAVIAIIYLLAVLLAWVTKIDIAYLFAPAIFFISGWEFVFGILGYLNLGMESLVFFIGATLLVLLIGSREFRSHLLKSTYAPSTVAFISLSLISLYKSKDWALSQWDEFSHWGTVVKAMYEFKALGPATPADLWAVNYPPGVSLFQYFVLDFSPYWREGLLFWATHLMVISLLVSVLAKTTQRLVIEVFFKLFLALVASIVFFNPLDNIYSDPLLALAFGFSILISINAATLEGRWWALLALSAGFITLAKPIGIYFALSAISINVVATLFNLRRESLIKAYVKFAPALISLGSAVASWVVWRNYCLNFNSGSIGSSQEFPIGFGDISNQDQVVTSFVNAFFDTTINPSYAASISSLYWTVICTIIFVFWTLLNDKRNLKRNVAIGIALAVTTFGYLCVILYSYLTVFGPGEATTLASYARYIGTWYQGLLFALVLLIASEINIAENISTSSINQDRGDRSSARTHITIFLLITAFLNTVSNPTVYLLMLRSDKYQGTASRASFDAVKRSIQSAEIPEQSKVWIIAQHTVGFEYFVLRYEMVQANFSWVPWSLGSPNGEGDVWTDPNWDLSSWSQALNEFNYVVVYSTSEQFNNEFGSLFESGIPERDSVYKVIKNDGAVSLSKVN